MTPQVIQEDKVHEGLEGIQVSTTKLSHVDGANGRLIIAGHDVEDLAGVCSFEQTCRLLAEASGDEPSAQSLEASLAAGRERAFVRLSGLGDALSQPHGMDALRAALAHLPETATRDEVIASLAVFTAAWWRTRTGLAPLAPSAASHAEDLLAMLGAPTHPACVRALDTYLVTVSDHGFNASTFAARVVASTRSDLVSAVVAAVGALKGPLHGGAPGPVLDMLDAIKKPANAATWLTAALDRKERIMGMGHRIYRQRDPRAYVLERALERLESALTSGSLSDGRVRARLELARAVEREAEKQLEARHPGRKLSANVEFYTAVLLEAVGAPRELFSLLFACGRSAGWVAHFAEQTRRGRLIRPSARYVGALPNRAA